MAITYKLNGEIKKDLLQSSKSNLFDFEISFDNIAYENQAK